MLIQAYRRKSESTHEVGGTHYKFAKNERGHFVCDVQDEADAERFLEITEGFKPYGDDASSAPPQATGKGPTKFVITNGDAQIDLGHMTDAKVKQFADDEELKIDKRLKGDNLREAVIAALKAE